MQYPVATRTVEMSCGGERKREKIEKETKERKREKETKNGDREGCKTRITHKIKTLINFLGEPARVHHTFYTQATLKSTSRGKRERYGGWGKKDYKCNFRRKFFE